VRHGNDAFFDPLRVHRLPDPWQLHVSRGTNDVVLEQPGVGHVDERHRSEVVVRVESLRASHVATPDPLGVGDVQRAAVRRQQHGAGTAAGGGQAGKATHSEIDDRHRVVAAIGDQEPLPVGQYGEGVGRGR